MSLTHPLLTFLCFALTKASSTPETVKMSTPEAPNPYVQGILLQKDGDFRTDSYLIRNVDFREDQTSDEIEV